ncbi:helix-turn-helix transcriptional regulator [Kitasatospora sp. NPDC005856]|uniref:helix-turn-helix domain-containing protein n=1 Tax=Kitasatospora sp. NPDC005856 TaxID=3154566 RepID=UPI0033E9E4E3
MAPPLHDPLGIDPDDPHTAAGPEDAEAYAALVETLVAARKKCGLTQRDVAKLMGTTRSTISAFERVGGDARYSTLQRYARAVGARLHGLVGHTGPANRSGAPASGRGSSN